jgi:hypothetical protein
VKETLRSHGTYYWFALAVLGAIVAVLNAVYGSLVWAAVFGGGALTLLIRGIYEVAGVKDRFVDPGVIAYFVLSVALVVNGIALLTGLMQTHEGSPVVFGLLSFFAAGCFLYVALVALGVIRGLGSTDRSS